MNGPAISKPRQRVLSDDEIRKLWLELPNLHSTEVAQIIKFCLITGQRIGEVVGITPAELDLPRRVWNIPGARTKNGFAHSVPLSPMALAIINETCPLPELWNISRGRVLNVIRLQLQFGERWTAHDLRRTALSGMAELGIAPIVLGHVANHRTTTKAGITLGVYVQHAYEKEKREALELWADRLQGIISGGAQERAQDPTLSWRTGLDAGQGGRTNGQEWRQDGGAVARIHSGPVV
jgi:integrase